MTREQFEKLKTHDKVKVVGNSSRHYYRIGGVYPIRSKMGNKVYLETDEVHCGERCSSLFAEITDIELYHMTRNAEVKELLAANTKLEESITTNNARIAWLKTYKDNLDETLQSVAKTIGISDKTLLKKLYVELKKEGIDPNFIKVPIAGVAGTPVPAGVGLPQLGISARNFPITATCSTVSAPAQDMVDDMSDYDDGPEIQATNG